MILDDIMRFRREQLERERTAVSLDEMRTAALECKRPICDFKAAISKRGINIISEVKKASPSKGLISPDFHPVETAVNYERSGAAAISILTEEHYFMGKSEYVAEIRKNVSIPLLRKDFIFDPYQIYEARVIGADAILLIGALLSADEMRELRLLAESLGMAALCESHNEAELQTCINAGAEIFGINNRNLKSFEVSLETTAKLARLVPEGGVIVSESGMFAAEDVTKAAESGANAVLIGESFMRNPKLLSEIKERMKNNE